MIRVCHPTVNAYTRNIVRALAEAGLLERFQTTLGWNAGSLPGWVPGWVRSELARRELTTDLGRRLRRHPWLEAGRLVASAAGLQRWMRHEEGWLSVDAVYRDLDAWAARQLATEEQLPSAVYCGEDAAAATFGVARQKGLRCFYDLPIAHHRELRRLIEEEKERLPAFASTLQGAQDSPAKLERKDEELALADGIVVCSEFVRDSLTRHGIAQERIRVVRYGAPENIAPREAAPRGNRPLRVLFAGALTQRKGIGDVMAAIDLLGRRREIEWVVMGTVVGDPGTLAPWRDHFRYEAPRPHAAVLELMRSCDVFVLPSIVEGFALVIAEAMACGLPVIVTPNTGAGGFVEDGVEGCIIPIRASEILAAKVSELAGDRDRVVEMGRAAARKAAGRTWAVFRRELVEAVGGEAESRKLKAET